MVIFASNPSGIKYLQKVILVNTCKQATSHHHPPGGGPGKWGRNPSLRVFALPLGGLLLGFGDGFAELVDGRHIVGVETVLVDPLPARNRLGGVFVDLAFEHLEGVVGVAGFGPGAGAAAAVRGRGGALRSRGRSSVLHADGDAVVGPGDGPRPPDR